MAIWKLFFSENQVNLSHFFHGKSFVEVEIIFSRLKFDEISPKYKNHWNLKWVLDCVIISCTQLHDPFTGITKALLECDNLDLSIWWVKILRQNCDLQTFTTIVGASPWLCHHSMNSLTLCIFCILMNQLLAIPSTFVISSLF